MEKTPEETEFLFLTLQVDLVLVISISNNSVFPIWPNFARASTEEYKEVFFVVATMTTCQQIVCDRSDWICSPFLRVCTWRVLIFPPVSPRTTRIWCTSLWWQRDSRALSKWEPKPTRTTRTTFSGVRPHSCRYPAPEITASRC